MENVKYHFLLKELPYEIRKLFVIKFDYVSHNYLLYRTTGYTLKEFFCIIRTSNKCSRVMHYKILGKGLPPIYEYFSAYSCYDLACKIKARVSVEQ